MLIQCFMLFQNDTVFRKQLVHETEKVQKTFCICIYSSFDNQMPSCFEMIATELSIVLSFVFTWL